MNTTTNTSTNTSTLAVEGMTCPSCVARVSRALHEVDGVTAIDVRLREGTVIVKHDDEAAVGALVDALWEAGYPSSPRP